MAKKLPPLSFILMHAHKLNTHPLIHGYPFLRTRLASTFSLNTEMKRCNSFISRLCKEGRTDHARKVFDQMPERDMRLWDTMINGYIKCGMIKEARKLFDQMAERDTRLWTTMLNGYIECGMIKEARKLFDGPDAEKSVSTWSTMVNGYVKINQIEEAERLFYEMPERKDVSWNIMMGGYGQNGQIEKALDLFRRMPEPERNVVSWNTIIKALVRCGRIEDAQWHFNQMQERERDVSSWTTMVDGLAKSGRIDDARALFDRMPFRNVVSWNAMVTGYALNRRLDEALELFERMPERDMASWNAIITGFFQNGELNRAEKLFAELPQKNVITWTAMMTGYAQHGLSEEALKIFNKMQASGGLKPNSGTFVTVLGACSDLAGLTEGQQIHQLISKTGFQDNTRVVSALINMYSKCGELHIARKIFDDGLLRQRDLISWNGMIAAYAHHGYGNEAINLFNKMQELGFQPNDVTYVELLTACSHAGLVEEGLQYFSKLLKNRSIRVREAHYACLVDLCGRAGRLKEAFNIIEGLGVELSLSVWGPLLAGCSVHGNADIGKLVAKKILKIEPESAGTYSLLSNMYASAGKWKEAANVRMKMKDKGLKKQPGCSWIEVGNTVQVFVVGDKSHSQSEMLGYLLLDLHTKMKKSGDILDDDLSLDVEL
ncbi:pentatricopeptide repeat-containing protein At2g35030, mitochondrial-like [Lotus japonicus]|uniref:pentatricopeptide repeat-containing protein At2g35030, mitochondrial-like n=1 Tax=Lotus japonicus TaxID=34305 RepID=UPI00258AF1FC|nr:pentatricopeptide repeat-containing protein At2g35030, mitochondrial-like [Lotus japonicus]XP_057457508.1 pentatricopeptide repeat-containing protein At2g35030, mitochondrial-like [Lotus japonicus]XP_057457509.1 pentatricopeptide repeat-containing protein At2g35030, mitochondrial-like [Lotus japonicus]XP_057457510.1 pentatricopeptide repeat-containing protein At2g35030, mitochondrial-like [Lotus japonicus]XP_057457511.1 pentatricopeptide repeat-containing protein At2g35030, mitochondrial-lik